MSDMTFADAMTTKDTTTENDMPAHSTTGAELVDYFFSMGAARNKSESEIRAMFSKAYNSSPLEAVRALFYNRDIRGGQGERRSFRIAFRYLAETDPEVARKNLEYIPEYGRWDDVLEVSIGTPVEEDALNLYEDALLEDEDALAAKWAPREGKSDHDYYVALRDHMGLSPKKYRKLVVSLSDTVEDKMCNNAWGEIDFSEVPSQAINIYRNAFHEHEGDRFEDWVDSLYDEESDSEIKADAIYPHEIVQKFLNSNVGFGRNRTTLDKKERDMLQAQWNELPDFMPKGQKAIPVCDVSGSMTGLPMEVSVSLGLYISERNEGPFEDQVITFSGNPKFFKITGDTLKDRVTQLEGMEWGANTDLEKTVKLVLDQATKHDVDEEKMPNTIIILSDMQFDRATQEPGDTALEMIERMYNDAGYDVPNIVFWNLRDSNGKPVKFTDSGVALVSGFSPSILERVLEGKNLTPISIVMDTVNSERYQDITL